jgi:hypothetical protein
MISPAGSHRPSSNLPPIALPSRPIQTSAQSRQIRMNPSICCRKATPEAVQSTCAFPPIASPGAALYWLNARGHFCFRINGLHHLQVTEPAVHISRFLLNRERSPGDRPRWPVVSPAGPHRPSFHRAPIQNNRPRPIPDGSVRTVPSAEERLLKLDQRHSALMTEYETLRSRHDELCAAHDPLGTPPFLRRIAAGLSPAARRGQLSVLQSARPRRPIRTPAPSQPPTHRIGSSYSAAQRTSSSASFTSIIIMIRTVSQSQRACSASSTRRRAGRCTA